jgi:hypothetical protein
VTVVTRTKVCEQMIDSGSVLVCMAGMNIHLHTSLYISKNEVEPRLGTYTEVLIVSITLTYSQNDLEYTWVNPHQSQASR